MARLPNPGGDEGQWGGILNDFLGQSHNADGSLKDDVISSSKLADGAVSASHLHATNGTNGQVLTRDTSEQGGLAWTTPSTDGSGSTSNGLPPGGDDDQVLAKASATDYDVTWIDSVPLSNTDPAPLSGVAFAGTLNEVSRADHQHPLSPGIGYPIRSGMYSYVIGIPGSGQKLAGAGTIIVSPLPVYAPISVANVMTLPSATNFTAAVYDASALSLLPRQKLVDLVVSSTGSGQANGIPVSTLHLNAGLYWVAVLVTGGNVNFTNPYDPSLTGRYVCNHGYDSGNRVYEYEGSYTSLPGSLEGIEPFIGNDGTFWHQIGIE